MTFRAYFFRLVRHSFHGAFRALEIGEAVTALIVHVIGYFVHEWKEPLEVLFVGVVALFVLTFFIGLIVAAHALHKETESQKTSIENKFSDFQKQIADESKALALTPDQQQFFEFVDRYAQDSSEFKIIDWGERQGERIKIS